MPILDVAHWNSATEEPYTLTFHWGAQKVVFQCSLSRYGTVYVNGKICNAYSVTNIVLQSSISEELASSIADATARTAIQSVIEGYATPVESDAAAMFAATAAVPNIGPDNMAAYKAVLRQILAKTAPGDNDTAEITKAAASSSSPMSWARFQGLPRFDAFDLKRPVSTQA